MRVVNKLTKDPIPTRRYVAEVSRKGVTIPLGRFATLEEAAYCYALSPEGLEDAAQLAEAEAFHGTGEARPQDHEPRLLPVG